MKLFWMVMAAWAIAGCSNGNIEVPPEPVEETLRATSAGKVIGFVAGNGAHVWRGVPYAASTAGANRWRAPRKRAPWEKPRPAIGFADRCPQVVNALSATKHNKPGAITGSEDCLALDVYAPPAAAGADTPRPVMVWIHGGSNVWGSSRPYDGSALAMNEGVVIVAIQYRLGPLGWFADQAIRQSALIPLDRSANFALLDQIAALKWVRENIGAFGGDPDNITIFGQSAGGHNVAALLASPLAKGLFHRAIIQSGSFDSVSLTQAEVAAGVKANPSGAVKERLGGGDAKALRAVSLEDLFAAYTPSGRSAGFYDLPRVIEDGVVLPATPLRDAFSSTQSFNAVPIITGTTHDEMKFFNMLNKRLTRRFPGGLIVARDQGFYDAISTYPTRIWRARSVDSPAQMMAQAGHDAVYAYQFDWDEGGRFLFFDAAKMMGAAHAMEIPFVFNNFVLFGALDKILFKDNTAQSRADLADKMGAYWAEFAREGAPDDGAAGLPLWPPYAAGGSAVMGFDSSHDGGVGMMTGIESLEAITNDLNTDENLDHEEKCRIVTAIGGWLPELEPNMAQAIECG